MPSRIRSSIITNELEWIMWETWIKQIQELQWSFIRYSIFAFIYLLLFYAMKIHMYILLTWTFIIYNKTFFYLLDAWKDDDKIKTYKDYVNYIRYQLTNNRLARNKRITKFRNKFTHAKECALTENEIKQIEDLNKSK